MTLPKPNRYIYIDSHGIDSLYAQTVKRVELETSITHGRGRKSRISGSLGLGEAIGSLFGLLHFKGNAESGSTTEARETVKSVFSVEQKLLELTTHLSDHGEPSLFTDLSRAALFASKNKDAVFVLLQTTFDVPQFYKQNAVAAINESQYVVFERDTPQSSHYDPHDDYFKKVEIPIVMSASLNKFPGCKGQMGATGHDAVYFRGHEGRDILLNVFGSLFKLPQFYQIKPYAIWL